MSCRSSSTLPASFDPGFAPQGDGFDVHMNAAGRVWWNMNTRWPLSPRWPYLLVIAP